ncbi:MAG: helix-turn-helix domain-containing protein [Pseudomonadota bacterium]
MADTIDRTELLDNEQTAALLGIKPNTLEIWRTKGRGPAFVKMGRAKQSRIRYQRSAIDKWLREQSFASTSGYSDAALRNAKPHNLRPNHASI